MTRRKLIPSLLEGWRSGQIARRLKVLAIAHTDIDLAELHRRLRPQGIEPDIWAEFAAGIEYLRLDFSDTDGYAGLARVLAESESDNPGTRLYYLACAPRFFAAVARGLARVEQQAPNPQSRLVVEKPFGSDLESARQLNRLLHSRFAEHQILRIDHYLGKDTVQNILVLRFANGIFEPLWNNHYIRQVQIMVAEDEGIGGRGGYYDNAGVFRDMFQNHLLQLLTLVAMEPPATIESDSLRNEKVKVLRAVRPVAGDSVFQESVRGQYAGYRRTERVKSGSNTATYAAVRLQVDNWRWKGVPFFLRSGKGLAKRSTAIVVEFNTPPHVMFNRDGEHLALRPNALTLRLQPAEGMDLSFETRLPGRMQMATVKMNFDYVQHSSDPAIPDAYERLVVDALAGDSSLFIRSDEIELSWRIIDPLVKAWEQVGSYRLGEYERGSWGPTLADDFIGGFGFEWVQPGLEGGAVTSGAADLAGGAE